MGNLKRDLLGISADLPGNRGTLSRHRYLTHIYIYIHICILSLALSLSMYKNIYIYIGAQCFCNPLLQSEACNWKCDPQSVACHLHLWRLPVPRERGEKTHCDHRRCCLGLTHQLRAYVPVAVTEPGMSLFFLSFFANLWAVISVREAKSALHLEMRQWWAATGFFPNKRPIKGRLLMWVWVLEEKLEKA